MALQEVILDKTKKIAIRIGEIYQKKLEGDYSLQAELQGLLLLEQNLYENMSMEEIDAYLQYFYDQGLDQKLLFPTDIIKKVYYLDPDIRVMTHLEYIRNFNNYCNEFQTSYNVEYAYDYVYNFYFYRVLSEILEPNTKYLKEVEINLMYSVVDFEKIRHTQKSGTLESMANFIGVSLDAFQIDMEHFVKKEMRLIRDIMCNGTDFENRKEMYQLLIRFLVDLVSFNKHRSFSFFSFAADAYPVWLQSPSFASFLEETRGLVLNDYTKIRKL